MNLPLIYNPRYLIHRTIGLFLHCQPAIAQYITVNYNEIQLYEITFSITVDVLVCISTVYGTPAYTAERFVH